MSKSGRWAVRLYVLASSGFVVTAWAGNPGPHRMVAVSAVIGVSSFVACVAAVVKWGAEQ